MTKSEAKDILIEWLDHSNHIRRNIKAGNYFQEVDEWFSRCAEMHAVYKAISDFTTGLNMPVDRPHVGYDALGFAEMEDFTNDGCNGFTRQ